MLQQTRGVAGQREKSRSSGGRGGKPSSALDQGANGPIGIDRVVARDIV
jgi:hypothetical protein